MGGEEVAVEPAGGMEDGAIGTDAERVRAAVERVRSPDGVLVLMDLGSALMSAEMAVEMAEPDGGPIVLSAAPLVEGAVAAAARARGGAALDEVAAEARGALAMKTSQLGEDEPQPAAAAPDTGGDALELRITVTPALGLHARPAARFVGAVSEFDAQVEVSNATRSRGPADARSLTGIATLGVRQGDEIVVRASGGQAAAVLDALRALAADNFGDPPEPRVAAARGRRAGGRGRRRRAARRRPRPRTARRPRRGRPAAPRRRAGRARRRHPAARDSRLGRHRHRPRPPAAPAGAARRRRARGLARRGASAARRRARRRAGGPRGRQGERRRARGRRRGRDLHRPRAAARRHGAHRPGARPRRTRRERRAGVAGGRRRRRRPRSARSTTRSSKSAPSTSRTSRAACWRASPACPRAPRSPDRGSSSPAS